MITPKGKLIEINNSLEWILFDRIIEKTNPIKLLKITDALIQLPNFLFALGLTLVCFIELDIKIKMIIPPSLYFIGQLLVNSKLNLSNLIIIPASLYAMANHVFMLAAYITSFIYLKWWASLLFIPIYFFGMFLSISITTSKEKNIYQKKYNVKKGNLEVYKNNAFLSAYKHTAKKLNISINLNPTEKEISNHFSDRKHFIYMRENWGKLKGHFDAKAQHLWTAYLFPES